MSGCAACPASERRAFLPASPVLAPAGRLRGRSDGHQLGRRAPRAMCAGPAALCCAPGAGSVGLWHCAGARARGVRRHTLCRRQHAMVVRAVAGPRAALSACCAPLRLTSPAWTRRAGAAYDALHDTLQRVVQAYVIQLIDTGAPHSLPPATPLSALLAPAASRQAGARSSPWSRGRREERCPDNSLASERPATENLGLKALKRIVQVPMGWSQYTHATCARGCDA